MCLLVFFLFVDPHFKLHCLHEGRSACVPAKKRFVVTTERSDCRHRQFLRKFRLFRLEAFSAQVWLSASEVHDDVREVLKINVVCERDSYRSTLWHILGCLLKSSAQKSATLPQL